MKTERSIVTARILLLIPLAVFVITVVCFIAAVLLERPTDRGQLYCLLVTISFLSMLISPIPCLVMSAIGTARKAGCKKGKPFLVLGGIEIVLFSILTVLAVIMFFGAQSV